jgi:t-SNARE complex subunit (syntaxin)
MISVADPLRVRFFSQSLTGPAFGWYTSLGPDSIRTWKQLEEQFHVKYRSEATEAGIADLAQVRQKQGETVADYIQRFRKVKNRCYSIQISEKEAVKLATLGLVKPTRDLVFQLEFNSLAHLVQKMTIYEQRHPELYQDKFKRQVIMVDAEDSEDSEDDPEIAVVEGHGGQSLCPASG